MSPRIGRLVCGHERWLPFDYANGPLTCSECDEKPLREVAKTSLDFEAMTPQARKELMRVLRERVDNTAVSGEPGDATK